jgi:hypothetical protein
MAHDLFAVCEEVLMAREIILYAYMRYLPPGLDTSVLEQLDNNFMDAVYNFFQAGFDDSVLDPDDQKMWGRIAEDAGKQRRMKQKYTEYIKIKGGSKGGRDRKLEANLAEDA